MRIFLLGGTGDMGRRAAAELVAAPEVTRLTVAGRDRGKAEALAASLGSPAVAAAVDARDEQALSAAMADHDVVAAALGPFYRFEVPVARAAVQAGLSYVSICDDHDAVEQVFSLDKAAKDAGVTVLTGAGWTPGLTNVMARRGAALMDDAEEVHVAWVGPGGASGGEAVVLHVLHIVTGQVPTFTGGALKAVRAGTGRKIVEFPPPLGPRPVWHVGHPEPVTLPRFMPALREVSLRGGLAEPALNRLVFTLGRSGLARPDGVRQWIARTFSRMGPVFQKVFRGAVPPAGAHVEVKGKRDGRAVRVILTASGSTADLTAIPFAVATLMIGRGDIRGTGVLAPEAEGGIPPGPFLEEVGRRGIPVEERLDVDV